MSTLSILVINMKTCKLYSFLHIMVIGASPSTKTSALQTTRLQLDRICRENSKVMFVNDG